MENVGSHFAIIIYWNIKFLIDMSRQSVGYSLGGLRMKPTRRKLIVASPFLAASATTAPRTAATPLYSEVLSFGNPVFVSGHGAGIQALTGRALDEIEACLKAAGTSMRMALKCNVLLRRIEDFAAMNEVCLGRFGAEPPVRSTVAVAGIPLEGCLVEIEVIAGRAPRFRRQRVRRQPA